MAGGWTKNAGLLLGALALAGCSEGQMPGFLKTKPNPEGAVAAAPQAAGATVERDVESPEAFQVTDRGLWDGRPSLGGVWVSYENVTEPERVIIRNTETDKFVIGALFRRERLNPGPPIQVSSDAAAALGMLAGAPARLNVTALRRAEVPVAPPQPDPAPPAAVAAAPSAAQTGAQAAEITAKPLDEVTSSAAAAIDSAEGRAAGPTTAPARRTTAATAATPAPATTASHPRPFLQVGIFSQEANATRAGDRLRGQGVVPTVRKEDSQGKTFWRVIVGPANTGTERDALLAKARDAGFGDAYFVAN